MGPNQPQWTTRSDIRPSICSRTWLRACALSSWFQATTKHLWRFPAMLIGQRRPPNVRHVRTSVSRRSAHFDSAHLSRCFARGTVPGLTGCGAGIRRIPLRPSARLKSVGRALLLADGRGLAPRTRMVWYIHMRLLFPYILAFSCQFKPCVFLPSNIWAWYIGSNYLNTEIYIRQ
jgi:hypothetical protein